MNNSAGGRQGASTRLLTTSLYVTAVAVILLFLLVILGYLRISSYGMSCHDELAALPHHRVGLLLGTSHRTMSGQDNVYFTNRITTAVMLYEAHKIDYILVSGDNRHASYNEPRAMTQALIRAGVPSSRIFRDFAGFSTLDSVVRARKVFALDDFTVISQNFQNERALFIADHHGIQADAFNAPNPSGFGPGALLVIVREIGARLKCLFDIYILNSRPTFLGEKEILNYAADDDDRPQPDHQGAAGK